MSVGQQATWPVKGPVTVYSSAAAFPTAAPQGYIAVAADTGQVYEFYNGAWTIIAGPNDTPVPGGPQGAVQFNNAGAFAGNSGLTYSGTDVSMAGSLNVPTIKNAAGTKTTLDVNNSQIFDNLSLNKLSGDFGARKLWASDNSGDFTVALDWSNPDSTFIRNTEFNNLYATFFGGVLTVNDGGPIYFATSLIGTGQTIISGEIDCADVYSSGSFYAGGGEMILDFSGLHDTDGFLYIHNDGSARFANGNLTIDTSGNIFFASTSYIGDSILVAEPADIVTVNWNSTQLNANDGSGLSANWTSRVLKDAAGEDSILWDSRYLMSPDGYPRVDWSGNNVAQGLNIDSGSVIISSGYFLDTISSSGILTPFISAILGTDSDGTVISSGITVSGGAISYTGDLNLTGNIISNAGSGIMVGTATTQKLGFFGSTPIVKPAGDVVTCLQNLGLISSATLAINAGQFSVQAANKILAGPASGGNATPSWRSLVYADVPSPTMTSSTATTVTFNAASNDETIYDTSGTLVASQTINLPSATRAGQICRYVSARTATSVTVNGTVSVGAALTTLAANGSVAWQAVDTSGTFVRIQ